MTSDSPNRKWQTNAGLKKIFLCRYGVLTKTRSTTFSSHPMPNLLLLELLGSLRAHHQDSLTPSQHHHLNLHWSGCHLLLPLHHPLLQTLVDGILISIRSGKRNTLFSAPWSMTMKAPWQRFAEGGHLEWACYCHQYSSCLHSPPMSSWSVAAFQYIALYSFPLLRGRGRGRGRFSVCFVYTCKAYDPFCNIDVHRILELKIVSIHCWVDAIPCSDHTTFLGRNGCFFFMCLFDQHSEPFYSHISVYGGVCRFHISCQSQLLARVCYKLFV